MSKLRRNTLVYPLTCVLVIVIVIVIVLVIVIVTMIHRDPP